MLQIITAIVHSHSTSYFFGICFTFKIYLEGLVDRFYFVELISWWSYFPTVDRF